MRLAGWTGEPGSRTSPRPQRVLAARRRLQAELPEEEQEGRAGGPDVAGRARRRAGDAGARLDRSRRHERGGRALQGLPRARHQADHRHGGLPGRRPQRDREPAPLRAQPPDPARAQRRGVPQYGEAELGRLSRGLLAGQGEPGHGADLAALAGRAGADRLPAVPLLPPHRRGPPRRRPRSRRRADPGLRSRAGLLRAAAQRHRRAGQGQRGDREGGQGGRPPAGRDRGRPLPDARRLRQPRGAALRADEVHRRRAEAEFRHQRVLPQEPRGDGEGLRRVARGDADHARDRRALRGGDGAREAAAAALRDSGGDRARADAPRARQQGPGRPATATPSRRTPASDSSSSSA